MITSFIVAATISAGSSAELEGWFKFHIPSLSKSIPDKPALDLSFLNPKRAGADGFLRVRGEEFVDGKGRPVRLFGVNICDFHVMPPKELAPQIARRLKQLGMNAVRLHYADWEVAPDGLMKPDRETIDPVKLDQKDYFISHLIENGIYVNINLHVARRYAGLPEKGVHWMGKVVDRVVPKFIESQKSFARQLLTHKNPYTKTEYRNEPGIAIIELNNENSLLEPSDTSWNQIHTLPSELSEPVRKRWNDWLRQKYGTTERLQEAWRWKGARSDTNLARNGDFSQGDREWSRESSGEASHKVENGELVWTVTRPGTVPWSHQLHQFSLALKPETAYTVSFEVAGSSSISLESRVMQSGAPWGNVGPAPRTQLSANFQTVSFSFQTDATINIPLRLTLSTMNEVGTVRLRNVQIREGGKSFEIVKGSLERGDVTLDVSSYLGQTYRDLFQFMVARELETTRDLNKFLRETLKVRQMVIDTQINYGSLVGYRRTKEFDDFVDIHEYPAHPRSQGRKPDGGFIWSIPNESMVREVRGTLERLGRWRIPGRPFVVSEFDLNPTNEFSAESFPLFTLMACLQGWRGLNEYSWLNFQPGRENPEAMIHPFTTQGNNGQLATIPFSALVFRLGLIPQLDGEAKLTIPTERFTRGQTNWGSLHGIWDEAGAKEAHAWLHRLSTESSDSARSPSLRLRQPRAQSPVRWVNGESQRPELHVNSPGARMLVGWIGDGKVRQVGDLRVTVLPTTRQGYAQVLVASLDGLPLSRSRRVLATFVSRTQNQDLRWLDEARTISELGNGPAVSEPVEADLSLPGTGWRATTLSGTGHKKGALSGVGSTFSLRRNHESLWVLFER